MGLIIEGRIAVQITVLVPKGLPEKTITTLIPHLREAARTVLMKGQAEHVARSPAAEASEYESIVVTILPTPKGSRAD